MKLTPSQLATTLAALRNFQNLTPTFRVMKWREHFADTRPLDNAEIDALCEVLNSPDEPLFYAEIGAASDDTLTGKLVDALRHLVAEFKVGDPHCTEGLKALAQWEEESGS